MNIVSRRTVIAGLAGLSASGQSLAQESGGERSKRIAARVARFRSQFEVPGLSVAFTRKDKLVYAAAFGEADRAAGERLTTTHRFRIASISKPITASAVMLLVESGKLDLRQTIFGVEGILGAFDLPQGSADWLKQITIDHLLTHTTGAWSNDNQDPMFMDAGDDHAALIRSTLARAELTGPPGKTYAYSNFGYCLLGRVIEKISGETYEAFVRRAILRPAGADGMTIAGNRLDDRQPNEVVYYGDYAYDMNVRRMDAHGGWVGSAVELVRFCQTVDGYKSVADTLSRKSVDLMATPTRLYNGYGRGWTLNPRHRNRWHTGSLPGTTSILVRVQGDVCFAGLTNIRTNGSDAALDALMWDIHAEVIG